MLRLQRIGRRNEAHFKIVVIEKTKGPKSQKYVDIVGSYNPKLGRVQLDADKVKKHLSNGVQPSDTVRNMLITQGLLEGRKINVLPQKSPVINHEAIAKAKEAAEAKVAAEEKAKKEALEAAEAAKIEAEATPEEVVETTPEVELAPEAPTETIAPEAKEEEVQA